MVTFYILRDFYNDGSTCGSFTSSLSVDRIQLIEIKAHQMYQSNKEGDDKATIFFRLLRKEDPTFQPVNFVELNF
jgi:hypothetical protein